MEAQCCNRAWFYPASIQRIWFDAGNRENIWIMDYNPGYDDSYWSDSGCKMPKKQEVIF